MTALNPQRKQPQAILAVENEFFATRPEIFNAILTKTSITDFVDEIHSHLVLKERFSLERDARFRQLLPYIVLRHVDIENGETYFFTYRRTKLVGESRLAGNVSIGIGGHIDLFDIDGSESVIDLVSTLTEATRREVTEELLLAGAQFDFVEDLDPYVNLTKFDYTILDTTNDVGYVHAGLVKIIDVKEVDLLNQITCREEELETIGFRSAASLLESESNIENWTRLLLEQF